MKTTSILVVRLSLLLLLVLFNSHALGDVVVYDNTTTRETPARFGQTGGTEFGDEIVLGGTARTLRSFTFEYYGLNFAGDDETLRFRIYRNDAPYGTNFSGPGTLLYDSGAFSIQTTTASTLSFLDLNILVPDNFTWTVQFGGIGVGESAGLSLYNPPTVGSSAPDYWDRSGDGNTWQLFTPSESYALNFGARASANTAVDAPVITAGPYSRTNYAGTTATFSVAVSGTAPFSYQWKKNDVDLTDGVNVSGATNNTLTIASVRESDAGSYRVVVTNPADADTSSNAALTVAPMLSFDTSPLGLRWAADGFHLTISNLLGYGPVTVYVSTDLVNWAPLLTNPPVTGTFQFIDAGPNNRAMRFYSATEQW